MKKIYLSVLPITTVAILTFSCGGSETKDKTSETTDTVNTKTTMSYTCPMHSEVLTDAPGQCPKCGMDLVKKDASEKMDIKSDSTMKMDSSMKM